MGLSVKRREINKKIKEIRKKLKEPLEEILKMSKYDMEDFRKQIEKELFIRKAVQKVDKDTEAEVNKNITDAYMKEYYDNNKEKYKLPERIRLRAITLKADPGGGPKHWGKIRARSMKILKRIEAGDDFAKLAEANSEDDYAKKGGDMGFIHKGSLVSELGSAVKGLEIGEVAGPVWTMYGYLLLKLEEKMPSIPLEYDEVKEGIKKDLKEREFTRIKKEWIAGLKEKAEIEYLEEEGNNKE
jgi:peptidyl-prolyl cis-trans isomerase C